MGLERQLDTTGLGGDDAPDAVATGDRRAADRVGKFNHCLNLMRGHGIARDVARGRALVDEAAAEGLNVTNGFRPPITTLMRSPRIPTTGNTRRCFD